MNAFLDLKTAPNWAQKNSLQPWFLPLSFVDDIPRFALVDTRLVGIPVSIMGDN